MKLVAPVFTLEGKELLPSGAILNQEAIRKLIESNSSEYEEVSLFRHATVAADIRLALSAPPYDVIFSEKERTEHLLSLLEKVRVIQPVLDSLDYFKDKDFHTYRHILTVFVLTGFLSQFLFADFEEKIQELIGSPTHDIGKINVPLSILMKREPLTRSELEHMRHHTLAGYCLLCHYYRDANQLSAIVARDHHERRNGKGYPQGLTDVNRHVELVVVADIYDALLSPRCYRPKSFDNRTAIEVITEMAERGEIGWDIIRVLVSQNRRNKPDHQTVDVSLEKRGRNPAGNMYGITLDDDD